MNEYITKAGNLGISNQAVVTCSCMFPCFLPIPPSRPSPQVAYTSSNGVANGGVHPETATHGEAATRPSSAASTQPGGKADPDMQVSRLPGPEGRGGQV